MVRYTSSNLSHRLSGFLQKALLFLDLGENYVRCLGVLKIRVSQVRFPLRPPLNQAQFKWAFLGLLLQGNSRDCSLKHFANCRFKNLGYWACKTSKN